MYASQLTLLGWLLAGKLAFPICLALALLFDYLSSHSSQSLFAVGLECSLCLLQFLLALGLHEAADSPGLIIFGKHALLLALNQRIRLLLEALLVKELHIIEWMISLETMVYGVLLDTDFAGLQAHSIFIRFSERANGLGGNILPHSLSRHSIQPLLSNTAIVLSKLHPVDDFSCFLKSWIL